MSPRKLAAPMSGSLALASASVPMQRLEPLELVSVTRSDRLDLICSGRHQYRPGICPERALSGLPFADPNDGYRSYFAPLFIAAVQRLPAAAGFDGTAGERYSYGACFLFTRAFLFNTLLLQSADIRP